MCDSVIKLSDITKAARLRKKIAKLEKEAEEYRRFVNYVDSELTEYLNTKFEPFLYGNLKVCFDADKNAYEIYIYPQNFPMTMWAYFKDEEVKKILKIKDKNRAYGELISKLKRNY